MRFAGDKIVCACKCESGCMCGAADINLSTTLAMMLDQAKNVLSLAAAAALPRSECWAPSFLGRQSSSPRSQLENMLAHYKYKHSLNYWSPQYLPLIHCILKLKKNYLLISSLFIRKNINFNPNTRSSHSMNQFKIILIQLIASLELAEGYFIPHKGVRKM